MEEALDKLGTHSSMRDIYDFCSKHQLENLAQGVSEISPPLRLREIASDLLKEEGPVHSYRYPYGEKEFREGVLKMLKECYNINNISVENILATSGVTGGICGALMSLKKEGKNKVALTNPFYPFHEKDVMECIGCSPEYIDLHEGTWQIDWKQLEKKLKEGLNALVVANPGNPCGNLLTEEEIRKLINLTNLHDCCLIFDEVYADFVWPPNVFYSPLGNIDFTNYSHVLVVRGFSKSLGCQSWRIGYVVGNPEVIKKIKLSHSPLYVSVPIQQHAVGRYLENHLDDYARCIEANKSLMQKNLKRFAESFHSAFGWKLIEPKGSIYATFYHNSENDMEAVKLALQKGVGVCPGSVFFKKHPISTGVVRVHLAVLEENAQRVVQCLQKP